MYLHLGGNVAVEQSTVVGIFDLDTSSVSKNTREFLRTMQLQNLVNNVTEDLPRSFVLCESKGVKTVYLSALTSQTLKKRINIFE